LSQQERGMQPSGPPPDHGSPLAADHVHTASGPRRLSHGGVVRSRDQPHRPKKRPISRGCGAAFPAALIAQLPLRSHRELGALGGLGTLETLDSQLHNGRAPSRSSIPKRRARSASEKSRSSVRHCRPGAKAQLPWLSSVRRRVTEPRAINSKQSSLLITKPALGLELAGSKLAPGEQPSKPGRRRKPSSWRAQAFAQAAEKALPAPLQPAKAVSNQKQDHQQGPNAEQAVISWRPNALNMRNPIVSRRLDHCAQIQVSTPAGPSHTASATMLWL